MSSDLHLLSFSVTCLFKKREKEKKKKAKKSTHSPLDGACESSPSALWYSDSPHLSHLHRFPSPNCGTRKETVTFWEMEIRQGYYVWGLFSQNRVWHGAPAWKCFNGRFHQLRLFVFVNVPRALQQTRHLGVPPSISESETLFLSIESFRWLRPELTRQQTLTLTTATIQKEGKTGLAATRVQFFLTAKSNAEIQRL
jgi:hypothetical protein